MHTFPHTTTTTHLYLLAMARQFFVGGNFKLNPVTREEKKKLIKTLNDADIDQNTGAPTSFNEFIVETRVD